MNMASSNPSSVPPPPLPSFEFQADDGAWYNVLLELDGDLLTVNYFCFPSDHSQVFDASHFTSFDDLESFARRFRPSSPPLQDEECYKIVPRMRVLAACRYGHDDVRFFEVNIEEVERQDHTTEDGSELCHCAFLLHWLDGPNAGNLTCAGVADICVPQSTTETHPEVDSFLDRSMELLEKTSFTRAPTSRHDSAVGAGSDVSPPCEQRLKETHSLLASERKAGFFGERVTDLQNMMEHKFLMGNSFVSTGEQIGNLGDATLNNMEELSGQHVIVIENLEEDISSEKIVAFVHEKLHISPKVCLFLEPYAWAVVMGNDKEEFRKLRDFLGDPNQIVVSSRVRPWVTTYIEPRLGTPTRILLPKSEEILLMSMLNNSILFIPTLSKRLKNKISRDVGLKIVHSSNDEYQRAKQLRDLFMEFKNSQQTLKKSYNLGGSKV